jgi:hypothetical protein
MARSALTALLAALALGCLVTGVVVATTVDGDKGFGFGVAILCAAPAFAVLALAMRFGLGGDDDA